MNDNVQLAKTSLEAFTSGDIETFLGHLRPDCEWISPEGSLVPGTFRGPQELIQNFLGPLAEQVDLQINMESIDAVGDDEVLVRGTYRATYRENGRTAEIPFLQIEKWKDGKLQRFQDFYDTKTARVDLPE